MERDFKGIWIPKEIWLSKELTLQEKVFLVEIDSLDNEEGCFANNNYFAEFFGLSKNRCSEIIKSLEAKGLVTIEYIRKEGRGNIEKRIIRVVDKSNRGNRETDRPNRLIEEGCSEKCEDNNTILNNTNNKSNIVESEELWKLYPVKAGKGRAIKKIPNLIKKYGFEQMKNTITRYVKYVEYRRKTDFKDLKLQNGDTFFNGTYEDYLDENYTDTKPKPIERNSVKVIVKECVS